MSIAAATPAVGKNPLYRFGQKTYVARVEKGNVSAFEAPRLRRLMQAPLPRSYSNYIGRKLFRFMLTVQGVGAFALITLGVILTKLRVARDVTFPAIRRELARSGAAVAADVSVHVGGAGAGGHRPGGFVADAVRGQSHFSARSWCWWWCGNWGRC